jgi:hypothetical protein
MCQRRRILRIWDICGSNVRLNHIFELSRLPYAGYRGTTMLILLSTGGEKVMTTADEGPLRRTAPSTATKKRKLGTTAEGSRASDCFAADLLETYAVPGETMSSPELRESSARTLKVTGGR